MDKEISDYKTNDTKKKEWVLVDILDEDNNPSGHQRCIRDFQWTDFIKYKVEHLRYIKHCDYIHIENK